MKKGIDKIIKWGLGISTALFITGFVGCSYSTYKGESIKSQMPRIQSYEEKMNRYGDLAVNFFYVGAVGLVSALGMSSFGTHKENKENIEKIQSLEEENKTLKEKLEQIS